MLRYKIIMLVILFLILFNFAYISSDVLLVNSTNNSLDTICLDAGHGGIDPGAINGKVLEKDINLKIVLALGKVLENDEFKIIYTRTTDTDLAPKHYKERKKPDLNKRVKIINESDCFMYLSIHLNASPAKKYRGPEMYYDDVNPENIKIAQIFYKNFKKYISTTRKSEEITGLLLYRKTKKPGILAEVGFLSNPNDKYLLTSSWYQEKIANILKESIILYRDTLIY